MWGLKVKIIHVVPGGCRLTIPMLLLKEDYEPHLGLKKIPRATLVEH
jgi:hypothetical protein